MHCYLITLALCALAIPASVSARPTAASLARRNGYAVSNVAHPMTLRRRNQGAQVEQVACNTPPAPEAGQKGEAGGQEVAAEGMGAAAEEKGAAAGGEEAAVNEVEIESAFHTAVPVEGGDLKQDLVFTASTVGKFEFEFQSAAADQITVTENVGAAAAAPPAGFEAIEPNSYTVALAASKGEGLTLSKIDYIFDAASAGLVGKDVTQAQVGKLCAETGAFVIAATLGELEFEVEENEVTLDLNKNVTAEGEWGIFLPVAAADAVGAAEQEKAALEAAEKEKLAAEAAHQEKAAAEKEKLAAEAAQKEQPAPAAAHEVAQKEQPAPAAAHEVVQEEKPAPAAAHEVPQEEKPAPAAAQEVAQQEKPAPVAAAEAHPKPEAKAVHMAAML